MLLAHGITVGFLRPRVAAWPAFCDPIQRVRDTAGTAVADRLGNAPVGPSGAVQLDDHGVLLGRGP